MEANDSAAAVERQSAQDALDEIEGTQSKMIKRAKAPTGYYALLGVAMAFNIFGLSQSSPWSLLYLVPTVILLGYAIGSYRTKVGMWSRVSPSDILTKSAWPVWLLFVVMVGCGAAAMITRTTLVGIVLGIIVFIAFTAFGSIWERSHRRQVGED